MWDKCSERYRVGITQKTMTVPRRESFGLDALPIPTVTAETIKIERRNVLVVYLPAI